MLVIRLFECPGRIIYNSRRHSVRSHGYRYRRPPCVIKLKCHYSCAVNPAVIRRTHREILIKLYAISNEFCANCIVNYLLGKQVAEWYSVACKVKYIYILASVSAELSSLVFFMRFVSRASSMHSTDVVSIRSQVLSPKLRN